MNQNKTTKYFKYAIGEIVLVVIGILIALQINNWNEQRKLENKKQELIINLIDDFEENFKLLTSQIEYSERLNINMDAFFENGYSNDSKISLDSLKSLSDAFFRPNSFYPLMTSYDEAKESGILTLLQNRKLFQELTSFQRNLSIYLGLQDQKLHSFFNGSIWDLKKTIGTLNYLRGVDSRFDEKQLEINEYRALIKTPLVIATLENQATLNINNLQALKLMKINSEVILESLNGLKK